MYVQTFPGATPAEVQQLREHGAETRGLSIFHHTLNPTTWRDLDVPMRLETLAHDFAHLVHNSLMGSHIGPTPPWLTEGFAVSMEFFAIDAYGFDYFASSKEVALTATQSAPSLRSLETWPAMTAAGWAGYALGFIACDFLAERIPNGPLSLVEICRVIGEGLSWQAAFQRVFGRTVEAFYEEFEAWRTVNVPPFLHKIKGTVTNTAGKPVSRIFINACLFDADGVGGRCTGGGQVMTGEDGSYAVPVADNSKYFLTFGLTAGASIPEQGFLGFYSDQSATGLTLKQNVVTVLAVVGSDVTGINVQIP